MLDISEMFGIMKNYPWVKIGSAGRGNILAVDAISYRKGESQEMKFPPKLMELRSFSCESTPSPCSMTR